ncbi:MAG TPA: lipid-A-disaccharide synthase [Nitrospirota bacterium]|nr:lipid-A-disaccharide synthase [Nitrospirota bacterium]
MKKILIIAGEASGDMHGANLVREIRKKDNALEFFGVGSKRMQEAGVHLLADASEISVVGATEVLTHLGPIYRVFSRLKRFLREERPALLILIDFPDFNILLGKAAKKLDVPVVYYISPQVWAWRKGRIKTIASLVRAMIVIFPFEAELYREEGVDARFVGHPLTDVVQSRYNQSEARSAFGLDPEKRTVALLPGSRIREIESLLPEMLDAAKLLKGRFPDLQFILPVAPTLNAEQVRSFVSRSGVPVTMVDGRVYDALRASDAALVASGTATLETGLMAVPMVIVYRVSALSYFIGSRFVRVDHVGLVNIVAGRRIVPELIQKDATASKMADALAALLADREHHEKVKAELTGIRALLGESGASARAAATVLEILGELR